MLRSLPALADSVAPAPQLSPSRFQYASSTSPDHVLALFAEHADSARALAQHLLFDRFEAEDVVQDVFLSLWRKPGVFDPQRGTSRAWLLTVVRNRSMDHLRRRVPREDVGEMAERIPDPRSPDVLEQLETAARRAQLWREVGKLPPAQADLIRRAYLYGQTHPEIAAATALPLGTVKSRIRLGLEKLRTVVQPEAA